MLRWNRLPDSNTAVIRFMSSCQVVSVRLSMYVPVWVINICLELEAFLEHYLRCASNGLQAVAASLSPKIQSTLINILDSISQIISCSSKFQTKPAALTVSISSIPLIPKAKYPTSFRGRWHAGSEQNKLVSAKTTWLDDSPKRHKDHVLRLTAQHWLGTTDNLNKSRPQIQLTQTCRRTGSTTRPKPVSNAWGCISALSVSQLQVWVLESLASAHNNLQTPLLISSRRGLASYHPFPSTALSRASPISWIVSRYSTDPWSHLMLDCLLMSRACEQSTLEQE